MEGDLGRELKEGLDALADAIHDEGPVPAFHRTRMGRHRQEWPTLWAAIDKVLEVWN